MSVYPGHLYVAGTAQAGQAPPQVATITAALNSDAQMVAAASPPGSSVGWQVYRVTVQAATTHAAAVGPAYVRVNGTVVEGTTDGAFDTDDTVHPIYVPPGATIDVIWPQLTHADDTATARFEYMQVG